MRKLLALALIVSLPSCGGGGGGSNPAAPSAPTPTPAPVATMRIADTSSPAGSTVALSGSQLAKVGLNWQVVVTTPVAIASASVQNTFLNAQGQECASYFPSGVRIEAGTTVFTNTSMGVRPTVCPFPFTTTRLRTTLYSGGTRQGEPVDHAIGWTFTDAGGGNPTPTPTPGGGGGGNVCAQYPRGGDAYNCGDFRDRQEAQRYHDQCDPGDRNNLDGDNDGRVCE